MAVGEHTELTANVAKIAVVAVNHEQDLATTQHQLTVERIVKDQPLTAEPVTHKTVQVSLTIFNFLTLFYARFLIFSPGKR